MASSLYSLALGVALEKVHREMQCSPALNQLAEVMGPADPGDAKETEEILAALTPQQQQRIRCCLDRIQAAGGELGQISSELHDDCD